MPPKIARPVRSNSRGQNAVWGPHGGKGGHNALAGRSVSPLPRSSSVPAARSRNKSPKPATERSSSAPARRPRLTWDHPDGIPIEELSAGLALPAVVVNVTPFGVFVDIGAERNALMRLARRRNVRRFARGDHIARCIVQKVDLGARRLQVAIEDVDTVVDANRRPLEDLRPGMVVEGVVDHINKGGCWVNVLVETLGRLNVPRRNFSSLMPGQVLSDLVVTDVDLERRKLGLGLDDPEASCRAEITMVGIPAEQAASSIKKEKRVRRSQVHGRESEEAKTESRTDSSSKPKAKLKPALIKSALAKQDALQVGTRVDGTVTSITSRGVIVDLGKSGSATLQVSSELKAQMQKGDQVQGMKVESVSRNGNIFLSMEEPMLEIMEVSPAIAQVAKAKPRPKSKSTAKPPSSKVRQSTRHYRDEERAPAKAANDAWQNWHGWHTYDDRSWQ